MSKKEIPEITINDDVEVEIEGIVYCGYVQSITPVGSFPDSKSLKLEIAVHSKQMKWISFHFPGTLETPPFMLTFSEDYPEKPEIGDTGLVLGKPCVWTGTEWVPIATIGRLVFSQK